MVVRVIARVPEGTLRAEAMYLTKLMSRSGPPAQCVLEYSQVAILVQL